MIGVLWNKQQEIQPNTLTNTLVTPRNHQEPNRTQKFSQTTARGYRSKGKVPFSLAEFDIPPEGGSYADCVSCSLRTRQGASSER